MKVSLRKYAEALSESLINEKDDKIAAGKIQNLLKLLTKRKQSKLIRQLPETFKAIWLKKHKKMEVSVVLAEKPSEEEMKNITRLLADAFQKEVILSTRVNPQIIGGMKLEFGDCVIDNTVAANLVKFKHHLITA